uniref:hypothetical protein n=1 Tax=Thaumasiovibrio subtropicus TaxID=1891207 RepID=UPI00131EAE7F
HYITLDEFVEVLSNNINERTRYIGDEGRSTGLMPRIDEFIKFNSSKFLERDNKYYLLNKIAHQRKRVTLKNIEKIFNKDYLSYRCDNYNLRNVFKSYRVETERCHDLSREVELFTPSSAFFSEGIRSKAYECLMNVLKTYRIKDEHFKPFTFLSGNALYNRYLQYKENDIPKVFYQHGSYLHQSLMLKYAEIQVADVNLVYNEFTRKMFEKLGAKDVRVVGSNVYNVNIKKKKIKYDFVYITYCAQYNNTA